MKHRFNQRHLCALVGAVGIVATAIALPTTNADSAAKLSCLSDWSKASAIVSELGLAGVQELTEQARRTQQASVVRTVLCRQGATYVYRVVMKDRNGRLRTETVDARAPFGRSGKPK